MQLVKVPIGNAFQFQTDSKLIVTAIRCNDIEFKHIVPVLTITNYFLLNKNIQASVICNCIDYETGLGNKQSTKLLPPIKTQEIKNISPGSMCQLITHNGYTKWILVLERYAYGCKVVAALGTVQQLQPTSIINDLGPSWKYDSIPDYEKDCRICPNCHQLSLYKKDDQKSVCLFCNLTLTFEWGE